MNFVILALVLAVRFSTEKQLSDHLLENYDRHFRPIKDASATVEVTLQLLINQILEMVIMKIFTFVLKLGWIL